MRAKASRKLAERRREHDVAGERDVGAGAGRDAVDGADDRHRQGAQLLHERSVIGLDGAAEIGRLRPLAHHAVGEILPGAEAAPGARQQHGAAGSIGLGLGERGAQAQYASPR